MADTTFTFLDAAGNVKTARSGSDGGGNLAPSAVLYDVNGAVLIGQKTMVASIPIVIASDQSAVPVSSATLATQATLAAVLAKLSSDPATQTTLAAILAQLVAGIPVSGTVTANFGTIDGAATEATLATLNGKIPASPATDRTTAAAPFSTRLSDGAAFYKATTPSDTQPVSAASLPLPTGAATEATLATLLTLAGFQARINTLGQKTMVNSTPVTIASDQSALPISTASLPLPAGAATEATLATRLGESDFDTKVGSLTETAPATDTASSGLNGRLQRIAQRITSLIALIPAALTGSGNFKAAIVESTATVTTKETRAATPAQSSVGGSATTVTLLASNANRLGATCYNDSSAILYLKLGATASATSFTVAMAASSYYEAPFGYTGIIDGIWASATGNARITELTA
jgi:hypothetical protein